MADKFPVTSRSDVLPSKNSFPKKTRGESFDDPANPLNKPVPLRKGSAEVNGWQTVVGDVFPEGDEDGE